MSLFKKQDNKLSLVKEEPFALEKELQSITEKNITEIFGLEFVASEFQHNGLRIDTLAYDPDLRTFIVIEYKKDKSGSVIDQGFAYLSLILNNQAEFVLEFNRVFKEKKGKEDFDWSQMKVMFLTRSFNAHQLEAINFKDLPIELWEVVRYSGELVQYSQVKRSGAKASIETLGISSSEVRKISKEVKSYSEEEYLNSKPKGNGRNFYLKLKEKMVVIDSSIIPNPTKSYISFQIPNNWRNIFYCHVFKDKIRLDLTRSKPKDFEDPDKKLYYNESSYKYYHQHISSMEVNSDKELEYSVYLIQQAYEKFSKEN